VRNRPRSDASKTQRYTISVKYRVGGSEAFMC